MNEPVIATCRYRHPEIGTINVKVNAAAKSLKARWVGTEVHITVPRNCPVDTYNGFIDSCTSRLIELRPTAHFSYGIIDGNFVDFEIVARRTNIGSNVITQADLITDNPRRGKSANGIIYVNEAAVEQYGFDSPEIQNAINDLLKKLAWCATGTYLLPHARALAEKVKHSPIWWDVKHSKTRLGWCSSKGVITLSPRLIFLPLELAEYIIYHELAHLSEMNHSQAFHEVCNEYCGGREAEYNAAVKAFVFPTY